MLYLLHPELEALLIPKYVRDELMMIISTVARDVICGLLLKNDSLETTILQTMTICFFSFHFYHLKMITNDSFKKPASVA